MKSRLLALALLAATPFAWAQEKPAEAPKGAGTVPGQAFSVVSSKSGKTYFLHSRTQQLKDGKQVVMYYFAGAVGEGAVAALPDGYEVSENVPTGLPLLKKTAK